jgi:glutamate-1-semialdehyde 2,1-aminomutase
MSTLNCPEEVFLAEQLVELHPWADMVRFARTGGEANSIAIRIGRASSGRDKVAICGYHGWHDWYLSANLGDHKGLDGHLLPGLEPNGVPRDLKGSVIPFQYNDLESLEKIVANENIGVIMMEVFRNQEPRDNFLQKVRDLATKNNIVLIFDECTSGFRQTYGGLHIQYGVNPDIAVFGKALGNGYAVTAIVGKKGVMEAAQTTFISSTFWTERIGSVAGLKTLERMKEMRSWELITDIGKKIQKQWKKLAVENSLGIEIAGLPALASFSFNSKDNLKYKTLITQEMLKEGFLASNAIYSCVQHSPEIMNRYFEKLNDIFKTIRECEDGRSVDSLLLGPVCHSGFKRLN